MSQVNLKDRSERPMEDDADGRLAGRFPTDIIWDARLSGTDGVAFESRLAAELTAVTDPG